MSKAARSTRLSKQDIESRVEFFTKLCQERNIRLTPQRIHIYREIAATGEHPDAESIFVRIKKHYPAISRDTVYRTLYMLEEEGLLSRVEILCDRVRFDANMEPHHHFICTTCGSVHDFYSTTIDSFRPPKMVSKLGTVASKHLELRGTCAQCEKKTKKR